MFGFGEKSFLGVDIGTSSIKIIEIKIQEKKPVLSNYAWMKIPTVSGDNNLNLSEVFLAECVKKMLKDGKFSRGELFMSIQSFGALVTLMDFPALPVEDLEQAIQFEAHKYVPASLEDVSLNWGIVKNGQNTPTTGSKIANESVSKEKIQVLLVAVPKNRIARYESIARKAGRNLKSLEIESFSLVRSLVGQDPGNFILLDIGSRVCNIILVEKGEIKVSRNIDAGGKDITKAIATGLSINEERAESLKISQTNFLGKESNIVFSSLDLMVGEIKRILLSYYKNNGGEANIEGIILSGGTANLVGLDKYLSATLNTKVMIGNPFGRVAYEQKLEAKLKETGTQFSVAIGLALKGLES